MAEKGEQAGADPPGRIVVGRFGAPHGVRGEVRLQSFTQEPTAIGSYGPLTDRSGRRYVLSAVRTVKERMLVVRVQGISDRDAAAALNHVELFLERTALPPPDDEDEFYVADLIGLEAVDGNGSPIGMIVDVPNYGGGDLLEVRPSAPGETLLFAFTRAVVPTIDVAGRRVVIVAPDVVEAEAGDEQAR